MKALSLDIANFRNIEGASFHPCEGVNVIWGDNAQGKTNLLEALWLFTGAKSFRGAKDKDYIRFGCDFSKLTLSFHCENREQQASILFSGGRQFTLNGIDIPTPGEFAGHFLCVVFSPAHLSLVKEGPELRRRFLDTALCQLRPSFLSILSDYRKTLYQRNILLRDIKYHASLYDTLDVWDEKLAELGSGVIRYRREFVKALSVKAAGVYAGISGEREKLKVSYDTTTDGGTKEEFLFLLQQTRAQDLKLGTTNTGPHRDDLGLTLDGVPARSFASQGQQRSCVLALKLAEADILRESCGEYPVILLDDVMSELDYHRQRYILKRIEGHQVFITCCDPNAIGEIGGDGIFYMNAGQITDGKRGE